MTSTIHKTGTAVASTLMLATVLVLAPGGAHAQIDTGLSGDVRITTGDALDAGVDATATLGATTDEQGSGTSTDAEGSISGTEEASVSSTHSSSTSGTLSVNASGVAVVSSTQVSSEPDLKVFSSNMPIEREGVDKVDIESKNDGGYDVRVVYRHTGKLLGLIPITIKSTTVVESSASADPEVHSGLPWWSFLVTGKTYAKDGVESRVKGNTTIASTVAVNATPQEKARVAEAVIAEVSADASL